MERGGEYLMLHRTKKENDENRDKWIGVGGNPAGKEVTMWVRNVEFYCTDQ